LLEWHPGIPTESHLETLAWQLLRDEGFPAPARRYIILDERGKPVARVDFAFVEARVVIEADGYGSHSSPADLQRDRTRQNALVRLGWTVYRTTWADITQRPHAVAGEIAQLLRSKNARIS
jgi:very-short-patch-repair endonuclease